jgi:NADPH2:quinone reductase
MAQMKAIRVDEFGEPEVLKHVEVERPSPDEGEVLIEIKSAGVNYADTMRRRNQYVESQWLPFTPGSEVAGTVAEVGDDVEDVNVGDRVVTLLGTGGYAAYAVAPARTSSRSPTAWTSTRPPPSPCKASPPTTSSKPLAN